MDTNGLTKSEKPNKISIGKRRFQSASDVIMSLIDEKLIFIKTKAKTGNKTTKVIQMK
jgi:hypothetical protein